MKFIIDKQLFLVRVELSKISFNINTIYLKNGYLKKEKNFNISDIRAQRG
jgi:hypothetical protein